MRSIVKSTIRDVKLSDKDNYFGAGRPLANPKDVDNGLFAGILQLLGLHVSVSVLSLQEKYVLLILHSVQVKDVLKHFSQDIDYHFVIAFQSAKIYHSSLKDASPNSKRTLVVTCIVVNARFHWWETWMKLLRYFSMIPAKSICETQKNVSFQLLVAKRSM